MFIDSLRPLVRMETMLGGVWKSFENSRKTNKSFCDSLIRNCWNELNVGW